MSTIKWKGNGDDASFKLNTVQFTHTHGNNQIAAGVL